MGSHTLNPAYQHLRISLSLTSMLAIAIAIAEGIAHQEKEVIAPIRVDPDLIVSQDKNIETIASIETIDHVHMTEDKAQTSETANTHLINNKTIDTGLGPC